MTVQKRQNRVARMARIVFKVLLRLCDEEFGVEGKFVTVVRRCFKAQEQSIVVAYSQETLFDVPLRRLIFVLTKVERVEVKVHVTDKAFSLVSVAVVQKTQGVLDVYNSKFSSSV